MVCSLHFPKDGYPLRLKAASETITIRIAFFKHIALKKRSVWWLRFIPSP